MEHSYEIAYENILLQPLREHEALRMRILRNRMKHCFLTQNEISEEQQLVWYRSYLTKENDYMFAVCYSDRTFLGAIALYDIKDSAAEIGRVIIDKEQFPEKGLGRKAVYAACRIGFSQLKLQRIYANVLPDNIASLTVFRRLGFFEMVGKEDGCIYFEMEKDHFMRLDIQKN